jgi:hypothetical protein
LLKKERYFCYTACFIVTFPCIYITFELGGLFCILNEVLFQMYFANIFFRSVA